MSSPILHSRGGNELDELLGGDRQTDQNRDPGDEDGHGKRPTQAATTEPEEGRRRVLLQGLVGCKELASLQRVGEAFVKQCARNRREICKDLVSLQEVGEFAEGWARRL